MRASCLFLIIFSLIFSVFLEHRPCYAEITADEIVRKADDLLRGKTSTSVANMEIITPQWSRTISMESWSEGEKKFFIHITAPPREARTTFLKLDNNLYQWLPSAEMRIKISPSMMLQSWMGSDFTNDDLVKESSLKNDYTHKLLGEEEIKNQKTYKIKSTPKPGAPVVWGGLTIWFRTQDFIPVKEEFFNEKGVKIRDMDFEDIKQANDRPYPMKWTMTPVNKPGHKTVFHIKSIEFNKPLSQSIFTLKNLEKPR